MSDTEPQHSYGNGKLLADAVVRLQTDFAGRPPSAPVALDAVPPPGVPPVPSSPPRSQSAEDELERLRRQLVDLREAMLRRSKIEQAKGILMERHTIDGEAAFERIRSHARSRRVTVLEVSMALICAHGIASNRRQSA